MHRVEDGINGVRVFIPKCWFDEKKCARGIDAMKLYFFGSRKFFNKIASAGPFVRANL
jgi:hypothetical protein